MRSDLETDLACARAKAIRDELAERSAAAKGVPARPTPRYLTKLQLALAAKVSGAIMRPDWARALAEHNSGDAPYAS